MKKGKKVLLFICAFALLLQTLGMSTITVKAEDSLQELLQEAQKEKISGKFFTSDEIVYHVISKNKVEVCGETKRNKKNILKIPEKVSYKGKSYTVTRIIDMIAVDNGGYDEFDGEELSSPTYYDDVTSTYEYSNAYRNSMPRGTRKLSAAEVVLPKTITYMGKVHLPKIAR